MTEPIDTIAVITVVRSLLKQAERKFDADQNLYDTANLLAGIVAQIENWGRDHDIDIRGVVDMMRSVGADKPTGGEG